jgi:hypothetical protein
LRKPCVRLRLLRWGWNVLFTAASGAESHDSEKGALHNTPPGQCQRREPSPLVPETAEIALIFRPDLPP